MEAIEQGVIAKYAPQAPRFKGVAGLPTRLRRQIEFRGAKPRTAKQIAWCYRFLEIGDGPQAARDVGYSEKSAANQAWTLRQDFAPIIKQALEIQGVMDLPLARSVLLKVMKAYDPDARITVKKYLKGGEFYEEHEAPDPARAGATNAMAAVKAAEAYMDRFGMPKVTAVDLKASPDEGSLEDFRLLMDRMVAGAGIDAVRQMPWVMEHREYREYLEGKYGEIKDVTPAHTESAA